MTEETVPSDSFMTPFMAVFFSKDIIKEEKMHIFIRMFHQYTLQEIQCRMYDHF
jgi:hypothetical protein